MERGSGAHIVGHPRQALQKIQVQKAQAAYEGDDGDGQNDRRAFDRLEFHALGLNEKPVQLKAALVFEISPGGCKAHCLISSSFR